MQRSIRVLTAAFAVAVASLGGAFYLARERAVTPPAVAFDASGGGLASFDVGSLLGDPRSADRHMLDVAFRQLTSTYYKAFDDQTLLKGERIALSGALRGDHAPDPVLPILHANGDQEHDLGLLEAQLTTARTRIAHVTPVEESGLMQAAIGGMLASLGDPYTVYLSAHEIGSLEESLNGGDFGGIGVYIVQNPQNRHVLVEPIEGTPAAKAGIRTGDEIVTVDGTLARTLPLDDIERRIRGPIGTTVSLLVRTGHQAARRVPVMREKILVPSVHDTMLPGKIDYVRLTEFGNTSYDEVRTALLKGKAAHARGYILDLRDNGGGLLKAAVEISSLFVPSGPIVSTIDRAGDVQTEDALHTSIGTAPLVLLVNAYTASASEITAGAVQDDRVGRLIGTKTYGKGVVQSIYTLADGGALKITTARYVTPRGRDIQHKGIVPDVVVDQSPLVLFGSPADRQLHAAERYLTAAALAGDAPAPKNGHS